RQKQLLAHAVYKIRCAAQEGADLRRLPARNSSGNQLVQVAALAAGRRHLALTHAGMVREVRGPGCERAELFDPVELCCSPAAVEELNAWHVALRQCIAHDADERREAGAGTGQQECLFSHVRRTVATLAGGTAQVHACAGTGGVEEPVTGDSVT